MSYSRMFNGRGDPDVYWTNTGKHFGFPGCCIQAFLDENLPDTSVFDGTGYRPCHECHKKDPALLVDQINANRKHPVAFPDSTGFVEIYKESMYSK